MNKPPGTIWTHLLRGVISLSLAFVMFGPFALGQSPDLVAKQSVAASARTRDVVPPATGSTAAHQLPVLPIPKGPQVVLYDQYDNGGPNATRSTSFSDLPDFSTDLADDFVVPAGQTWNVQSIDADGSYLYGPGPANGWNVFIYADNAGLPGAQIFSATNQPVVVIGTTFTVNLATPAILSAGTYWIEIQANMTFTPQGEWDWTDRMLQANSGSAIRNPGGAVGCGTDWIRKIFCVESMDPDQVFRLSGTIGGGSIQLSARKKKVGGINTVRLAWSGATTDNVDVYRNKEIVATTPNDGQYADSTGDTGRARYKYVVCEAGTQTCSNRVTVDFPQ